MGYANPIEVLGYAQFAILCKDAGVDGVLTVDYPPEEGIELNTQLRKHGIDSIYLLAPTSSAARMEAVARMAGGYVYYVSLKGVTGASHLDIDSVAQRIPKIGKQLDFLLELDLESGMLIPRSQLRECRMLWLLEVV